MFPPQLKYLEQKGDVNKLPSLNSHVLGPENLNGQIKSIGLHYMKTAGINKLYSIANK